MLFGFGALFLWLYYIVFIWLWTGWRKFVSVPLLLVAAAISTPFPWTQGLALLGVFFALPAFGVWLGEWLDERSVRRAAQRIGVNLDRAQATDQAIPSQIKRLNEHSLGGFRTYDANRKENIRALRRWADKMIQNVPDRNGHPLGAPMAREEFDAAMQQVAGQDDAALDLMPHLQQQAISQLPDPANTGTPDLAGFPTRWTRTETSVAANLLTPEQMKQLDEFSAVCRAVHPPNTGTPDLAGFPARWTRTTRRATANILSKEQLKQLDELSAVCRAVQGEDDPSGMAVKVQPFLEIGAIGIGLVGGLTAAFTGHSTIGAVVAGAPLLVTLGQYMAARLMNSPGFVRAVMEHEAPESIGSIMNRTLGTTVSGRIWNAARNALRDLQANRK